MRCLARSYIQRTVSSVVSRPNASDRLQSILCGDVDVYGSGRRMSVVRSREMFDKFWVLLHRGHTSIWSDRTYTFCNMHAESVTERILIHPTHRLKRTFMASPKYLNHNRNNKVAEAKSGLYSSLFEPITGRHAIHNLTSRIRYEASSQASRDPDKGCQDNNFRGMRRRCVGEMRWASNRGES